MAEHTLIPGTRIKFRFEDDGDGNYTEVEGTVIGVVWSDEHGWRAQWCLRLVTGQWNEVRDYRLNEVSDAQYVR